jgi:hypothetical protein
LAVYSYEIKFYLNAIEGYSETIEEKKWQNLTTRQQIVAA